MQTSVFCAKSEYFLSPDNKAILKYKKKTKISEAFVGSELFMSANHRKILQYIISYLHCKGKK